MTRQATSQAGALGGRTLVITRPAGTAAALARQVRTRDGVPLLLPGLSLRATGDAVATREALRQALRDDVLVFTSPAAVRFAAALLPLDTTATVLAVGQGTARALRRQGVGALAPTRRQDSEGLLAVPSMQQLQQRRVALIGAPGGRGLLREQLLARGACLRELHVYRRMPPRLGRHHVDAVLGLPANACVLLSSGEALGNLKAALPSLAWSRLCAAMAVVSSDRIAVLARAAGFASVRVADSAGAADMLAAAAR
nr:uroporphyrinogen-III synthase [Dyella sp. A6]